MKSITVMAICLTVFLTACSAPKDQDAGAKGMGGFAVPVVGIKIIASSVQEKVAVVGSLAANESVEVKSEIDGKVTQIHFKEGQEVQKGDLLIGLDRAKLEATLAQSQSNLSIARTTFERMSTLVGQGAVSKQEYDQAKADLAGKQAQVDLITAQLADTVIMAPFDGYAGERKVSLGQVISKDSMLTMVIDPDPMKADFHVPERYIGQLAIGQAIELSVAAYEDQLFNGEVYFIDPQVDQLTRTVLVKAKVPNKENKLRSGMFAKLDLVIKEHPDVLTVPETALIPKGDEVNVFTVDKDNKAQMNIVKTGMRLPGKVEITSGLNVGDTVITEGYQKIGPGSLVNVTAADMQTP